MMRVAVLSCCALLLLIVQRVPAQMQYIRWDDMRVDRGVLVRLDSSEPHLNNLTTGVIVVDQSGKGDSTTIQGAIDLVPFHNPARIKIIVLPGTYTEKVSIGSQKPYISLMGIPNQASNTIIRWSNKASDTYPNETTQLGTFNSATFSVFSDYFCATDITFENTVVAVPGDRGRQGVALRVASARAVLHRVRVLGSQDSLLDEAGCHLYSECFIQGAVDFVFGNARSLYKNSVLHSVANTSGAIAAQGKNSTLDRTGFSFVNCTVSGTGRVYLGRAWGAYSTVVYAYCQIEDIVASERWSDWQQPSRRLTSVFREFQCRGDGAYKQGNYTHTWIKSFSYQQARPYLDINFIDGDKWLRL